MFFINEFSAKAPLALIASSNALWGENPLCQDSYHPPKDAMPRKKENLRQKAYDTIKQEIVTLKLPPGSYLEREKLQERLNVGLTPVREALLLLEAENLVTSVTNMGFYVKELNVQSIKDLIENRMYLERYVGFLSIHRITAEEIEKLRKMTVEMARLTKAVDDYELVMKDKEFHTLIVKSTINSQLENIMAHIYNECLRIWFISHYEDLTESVEMHLHIIEVLMQKDWKLLEEEIIHHNIVFRDRVKSYFQKILSASLEGEKDFKVDLFINTDRTW